GCRSCACRLRLGENAGRTCRELLERAQLSRAGERHPRRGELAQRRQLLGQRRGAYQRFGNPWLAPSLECGAPDDSGLSTLRAPAALRDSEPGQIRKEAAL